MLDHITTKILHPAIGAEVRGYSIARHLDAEHIDAVKKMWLSHPVLLFRDQDISDAEHIQFARHFEQMERIECVPRH